MLAGRYEWFEHDVLDPAGDGPMMPRHAESAATQFDEPPVTSEPDLEATATQ